MKFIRHQLLTRYPSTFAIGSLGVILLVSSLLLIRSATAQTAPPPPTLKSEIDYLTDQVQKKGIISVLVTIKSPDLDALMAAPFQPGNQTLMVARIKAARTYSDQARARLLQALVGYHFKVASGMDLVFPIIGLDVDEATLTYLKTSPLVAGISMDHVMKLADTNTITGTD